MSKVKKTTYHVGFRCNPLALNGMPNQSNLRSIVRHYFQVFKPDANEELNFFRNLPSLREVIQKAGMAVNSEGKRFPHQWRFKATTLERATDKLLASSRKLIIAKDFHELLETVESVTSSISGVGELYVYDTTLRLGTYLGLYPKKVYLHRGTRDGAAMLGLDVRRLSIPISEFPAQFQALRAFEIEDILCIYKNRLRKIFPLRGKTT